jgi:hypothetical protein
MAKKNGPLSTSPSAFPYNSGFIWRDIFIKHFWPLSIAIHVKVSVGFAEYEISEVISKWMSALL